MPKRLFSQPSPCLSPKSNAGLTFASAARTVLSKAPWLAASLRRVMGAVLWGFLGVRKCKAMARDIRTIKPAELIVVAIVFTAIFVCILILIARLITREL